MTLKLGMQHWVHKYYQVDSNDDPRLTLTYFMARSNLLPYAFVLEKGKTMAFSETTVVYDVKMSIWTYMNMKGQGHLLTLDQGHSDSIFSNFFSWETDWSQISCGSSMGWGSNGPGHMTKMATMPIYGKTWKILLLCDQKADDLERWYVASGTWVPPSLFK